MLFVITFMYSYPVEISVTEALRKTNVGDNWRVRKRIITFIESEVVTGGKRGGKKDNVSYLAFADVRDCVVAWCVLCASHWRR